MFSDPEVDADGDAVLFKDAEPPAESLSNPLLSHRLSND